MKLYFIVSGEFVKVGVTSDLAQRMEHFRVGNPHPMHLAAFRTVPATVAWSIEKAVHAALSEHFHFGEWFRMTARDALTVAMPIIGREMRRHGRMLIADLDERNCARERALEEMAGENGANSTH